MRDNSRERLTAGESITAKYSRRQMFFYAVPEEVIPLSGFGTYQTIDLQKEALENQAPRVLSHESEASEEESSRILDAIQ